MANANDNPQNPNNIDDHDQLEKQIEEFGCPICMGVLKYPVAMPCGHMTCYDCIMNWMKQNQTCPLCKTPFQMFELRNCYIGEQEGKDPRPKNYQAQQEQAQRRQHQAQQIQQQQMQELRRIQRHFLLGQMFGFGLGPLFFMPFNNAIQQGAQDGDEQPAIQQQQHPEQRGWHPFKRFGRWLKRMMLHRQQ